MTIAADQPKFQEFRWNELTRVPRPITGISDVFVSQIVGNFDEDALGHPLVNVLTVDDPSWPGKKVGGKRTLDGNHRHAVQIKRRKGNELILCECVYNKTPVEETIIIERRQRDRRAYRQSDAFGLRLQRGEVEETEIHQILTELGLQLSDRGSGSSRAPKGPTVAPCKEVYAVHGAEILKSTLLVVESTNEAWARDGSKYHGALLRAIAKAIDLDSVDLDRLVTKLNRVTPGIIVGNATKHHHAFKALSQKRSIAECAYDTVMKQYHSRGMVSV